MIHIVLSSRTKKRSYVSVDELVERLCVVLTDDQRVLLERAGRRGDIVYADYNPYAAEISGTKMLHLGSSYDEVRAMVARSAGDI